MKIRKQLMIPTLLGAFVAACSTGGASSSSQSSSSQTGFVTVRDGEFKLGDSTYRYIGTNFWYGPILASEGRGGDRGRLARELDSLQALGVTNLRVLAGADGAEGLASHIEPTLQTAPGVYNDTLLSGLDYFIADLERRDMKAVIYLNNAWEWSGGFSTYLEWAGAGKAVNPADAGYPAYMAYAAGFVRNDSARALAARHVANIVGRVNTVTGKPYAESPAIMSWQLANEPRPFSQESMRPFADWIGETARLIKSIDPNHLVSVGSEGSWGCENSMDLWTEIHTIPEIDYATIHIWPYNWSWVKPQAIADSVDIAIANTGDYIKAHHEALAAATAAAGVASKPIVLEEFGYPRDAMAITPGSPVTGRDRYYDYVFGEVASGGRLAGVNFWAWGGLAQPAHETWQRGDDYTGDPAQEAQGLNSVFACDSTTIDIIRKGVSKLH
ncbi:MAG: beta-mannosidase [Staphylococcus sp.]|nr:beta-mannosidase [Staphylococcus sp.]